MLSPAYWIGGEVCSSWELSYTIKCCIMLFFFCSEKMMPFFCQLHYAHIRNFTKSSWGEVSSVSMWCNQVDVTSRKRVYIWTKTALYCSTGNMLNAFLCMIVPSTLREERGYFCTSGRHNLIGWCGNYPTCTGFLTTNHLALLITPVQPTQHTTNLLKPSKQLQRLVESIATAM